MITEKNFLKWLSVALIALLMTIAPFLPICSLEVAQDYCLDSGGCWDSQQKICINSAKLQETCSNNNDFSYIGMVGCIFLPYVGFLLLIFSWIASLIIGIILIVKRLKEKWRDIKGSGSD
ncbi:MAG: hypothetical protein KAI33_01285 [Elusimicrobiales bacterium]|nr:hypothetical protein [Elusimicrobiales bacterium]MCK5582389.1 hypothetical protein [Elusimicrobiales bacterium]